MFSICDLNTYFLVACAVGFLWYYSRSAYGFWRQRKVKHVDPVPFLGNTAKVVFGLVPMHEEYDRFYKVLHNEPFGGIYQFRRPVFFVKDPELVAAILIKDFKYFPNHGFKLFTSKAKRELLLRNLFFSESERWRQLRQKMSPMLSSAKLKHMHDQILDCVHLLTKSVDERMGQNDSIDLGLKEIFQKLTMDVIGLCAFGLDCHSNEKFVEMGRIVFKPRLAMGLSLLVAAINERLANLLNIPIIQKEVEDFFVKLVLDTVEYRRKNGIVRDDLLQLLMELQNSHVDPKFAVGDKDSKILPNDEFDELDIVANSTLFILAGFETTAATLSYCFYELALNQNIQDKIRSEVEHVKEKGAKLTYDMLRELTYMDATISETLRKYPPGPLLNRECSEDYTIPGTNITIPAGTDVVVPIWSIHHDWRYYPNPEVFDPERFLGDAKHSRPSGAFIRFGEGPRFCIGKRFAEMEIKLALAEMILKYEVKPCAKTEIPLKYRKGIGMMQTTCGTWVNFVKRK